jgi:hypothetical protein
MVGSSMIVEMPSARIDVLEGANIMAGSQWTTDDFLRYGGRSQRGKDSALVASPLGISCGPSEAIGRVGARKGGHYFFDILLDQRIELLDPKKWLGKELKADR